MKTGKVLISIFGTILLFAIILLVTGPSKVFMKRSITIHSPVDSVYNTLNNIKKFNSWSPWYEMDPHAKYSFEGPDSGAGAKMVWESVEMGSGAIWIVDIEKDKKVDMEMDFGYGGETHALFLLKPLNEGTSVTWTYEEKPGLVARMMYHFIDLNAVLAPDYEQGLKNLKKIME
ncbi:SRPBCC family protein [Fulvivirga sediminis]|uniref:SRPBCC family protein n=1 Tax=Fulvivirga sediminis TaxID=2803949 RepID=A0A937F5E3_9BACT|nr:SRPBCC family protein [Fulvivirga sediminis]MBL3656075.1 SRPBCC family protein [Fulvivirga sediminis]